MSLDLFLEAPFPSNYVLSPPDLNPLTFTSDMSPGDGASISTSVSRPLV